MAFNAELAAICGDISGIGTAVFERLHKLIQETAELPPQIVLGISPVVLLRQEKLLDLLIL